MADTTVKKVQSSHSPKGDMGQTYLASGTRVAMRMWEMPTGEGKGASKRTYETIGYVIDGRAELRSEDQTILLEPGDSWLVPADAEHSYRILEPFTAIEATAPPARMHTDE